MRRRDLIVQTDREVERVLTFTTRFHLIHGVFDSADAVRQRFRKRAGSRFTFDIFGARSAICRRYLADFFHSVSSASVMRSAESFSANCVCAMRSTSVALERGSRFTINVWLTGLSAPTVRTHSATRPGRGRRSPGRPPRESFRGSSTRRVSAYRFDTYSAPRGS